MSKTVKAKRIFSLGQYQNIEFSDEITDIPDELANDQQYMMLIELLQLYHIEKRFNDYYLIRKKYGDLQPEEAIALLEEEILRAKDAITNHIKESK